MSHSKKKITINAASAIIQVSFTAILYFFLYRYLLVNLGAKQLGVWSLILSFSSIANLANLGITSGLVKFVAEYLAESNEIKIGKLILTSTLTMTVFFAIISLIILFSAKHFLHLVIDIEYLDIALKILPISLLSLSLNAVSGVFTSVLEGFQKNYLRNIVYVISGIIMFAFTLKLTPIYHLEGVAMAQLIQAIFIFAFSLIVMFSVSMYNRLKYWKLSISSFKELFNYGYKFQVVSITQMLYEPTTKLLLSKYGGLELLGHYEMATKLASQFRALLVNANQVVVPIVAQNALTKSREQVKTFFTSMNRTLWFFTIPLTTILILLSPIISNLWIGNLNSEFIFSLAVLSISAGINILCGPSYFSCMGEGKLSLLIVVHIAIALINLVLGLSLGIFMGGYGIVLAWGIALSFGSILLIRSYNKRISTTYFSMLTKNDIRLLIVSFLYLVVGCLIYHFNIITVNLWSNSLFCLTLLLLYIPIVLKNDRYYQLLNLLKKK